MYVPSIGLNTECLEGRVKDYYYFSRKSRNDEGKNLKNAHVLNMLHRCIPSYKIMTMHSTMPTTPYFV